MANHLDMANIDSIVTLHQREWSQRRIARELGIDRGTVARHLQAFMAGAKPASADEAPIGAEPIPAGSKPATPDEAPIGAAMVAAASKPATVAEAPIGSGTIAADSAGLVARAAVEQPVLAEPPAGSGHASACAAWRELIVGKLNEEKGTGTFSIDVAAKPSYNPSMPRAARASVGGVCYHVINRGAGKGTRMLRRKPSVVMSAARQLRAYNNA